MCAGNCPYYIDVEREVTLPEDLSGKVIGVDEEKLIQAIEEAAKPLGGEMKYYWFTFSDGYSVCVKGFSKQELRVEENKHGKLLRKVEA